MTPKSLKETFILVHGAWHGSWCWHKITSRLKNLGHNVVATDLPGHYRHKHPFADITLSTYVEHVKNLLHASDAPVVLVGHSMAGIVITQVAEHMPDEIDRLIYVSAFVPGHDGSLMREKQQALAPSTLRMTEDDTAHSVTLEPSCISEVFYGNCNDEDISYALPRLQAQPLQPFVDKITISSERFGAVPKTYIECLQDKAI